MSIYTMEGRLKVWNEDKGFGFISSPASKDVFIHISALKNMSRRPVVDDLISYQLHTDNLGKVRAINAQIHGVALAKSKPNLKPRHPKTTSKPKKTSSGLIPVISLVIMVVIGFQAFQQHSTPEVFAQPYKTEGTAAPVSTKIVTRKFSDFSCAGKVYCSQMRSCAEAKFYVNNCPGTKMDGDSDGVPCERHLCK